MTVAVAPQTRLKLSVSDALVRLGVRDHVAVGGDRVLVRVCVNVTGNDRDALRLGPVREWEETDGVRVRQVGDGSFEWVPERVTEGDWLGLAHESVKVDRVTVRLRSVGVMLRHRTKLG